MLLAKNPVYLLTYYTTTATSQLSYMIARPTDHLSATTWTERLFPTVVWIIYSVPPHPSSPAARTYQRPPSRCQVQDLQGRCFFCQ